MPTDRFLSLTSDLRTLGGQRVWSLVISLFGDLAQDEGQSIDGPVLSTIMQGLDIKPEAGRVALHRLRKEGWLQSTKSGRISHHSLTPEGRAQSVEASPRIYANPHQMAPDWCVVIVEQGSAETETKLTDMGFTAISPRIFVGPTGQTPLSGAMTFQGDQVPTWLIEQAEPKKLQDSYAALLPALQKLQTALTNSNASSPMEIAILRCLVVHNWRRLVLKHPMLPAPLIDSSSPAHQCHLAVWTLLSQFPRPTLEELEKQHKAA